MSAVGGGELNETLPHWNVWRWHFHVVWGGELGDKKLSHNKNILWSYAAPRQGYNATIIDQMFPLSIRWMSCKQNQVQKFCQRWRWRRQTDWSSEQTWKLKNMQRRSELKARRLSIPFKAYQSILCLSAHKFFLCSSCLFMLIIACDFFLYLSGFLMLFSAVYGSFIAYQCGK